MVEIKNRVTGAIKAGACGVACAASTIGYLPVVLPAASVVAGFGMTVLALGAFANSEKVTGAGAVILGAAAAIAASPAILGVEAAAGTGQAITGARMSLVPALQITKDTSDKTASGTLQDVKDRFQAILDGANRAPDNAKRIWNENEGVLKKPFAIGKIIVQTVTTKIYQERDDSTRASKPGFFTKDRGIATTAKAGIEYLKKDKGIATTAKGAIENIRAKQNPLPPTEAVTNVIPPATPAEKPPAKPTKTPPANDLGAQFNALDLKPAAKKSEEPEEEKLKKLQKTLELITENKPEIKAASKTMQPNRATFENNTNRMENNKFLSVKLEEAPKQRNPEVYEGLGISGSFIPGEGFKITKIVEGSVAAKMGLKEGNSIKKIGEEDITNNKEAPIALLNKLRNAGKDTNGKFNLTIKDGNSEKKMEGDRNNGNAIICGDKSYNAEKVHQKIAETKGTSATPSVATGIKITSSHGTGR